METESSEIVEMKRLIGILATPLFELVAIGVKIPESREIALLKKLFPEKMKGV